MNPVNLYEAYIFWGLLLWPLLGCPVLNPDILVPIQRKNYPFRMRRGRVDKTARTSPWQPRGNVDACEM